MTDLKIGSKVVCPVTDKDGEPAHEIGFLRDINSRWAKVEVSTGVIRVGKTKIEPYDEPVPDPDDKPKKTDRSHLTQCRTSKGRKSVSNGDAVAEFLNGHDLDFVYATAVLALNLSVEGGMGSLKLQYSHLNNGQQRMCLGARIRKAVKNGGDECWNRVYAGLSSFEDL